MLYYKNGLFRVGGGLKGGAVFYVYYITDKKDGIKGDIKEYIDRIKTDIRKSQYGSYEEKREGIEDLKRLPNDLRIHFEKSLGNSIAIDTKGVLAIGYSFFEAQVGIGSKYFVYQIKNKEDGKIPKNNIISNYDKNGKKICIWNGFYNRVYILV